MPKRRERRTAPKKRSRSMASKFWGWAGRKKGVILLLSSTIVLLTHCVELYVTFADALSR